MEKQVTAMQYAYRQLYEIENMLRQFISYNMEITYGNQWFYQAPINEKRKRPRAPLEQLYLHELETILRVYPPFKNILDELVSLLQKIYPIRNLIAHCNYLSDEQFKDLNNLHEFVIKNLIVRELVR